ncbi:MAG: DUF3098 domain-containing protein [Chitinophagaceae bacterium]|nr:MAG: DUF3098 domain-containing protein [Chitinophagaceae bacterium]
MAKIQTTSATTSARDQKAAAPNTELFGKENYMWMLIGAAVLILGFFLMAGGKSEDPTKFNKEEIYSTTRITIAPILIIAGFVIEIFAIMKKPKSVN